MNEAPPRIRRIDRTLAVELAALAFAIAIGVASYFIIARHSGKHELLTPPAVASLLVANLLSCSTLIVLMGRRIARRRAARSAAGGRAELHVRLVAIFSVLASVPTVLLAVIASLLFQYGAEFWFSGQARTMLENSQQLAQDSYGQMLSSVDNENVALAADVHRMLFINRWRVESAKFQKIFRDDTI